MNMKRKLLLAVIGLSLVIGACNNPFFPEGKEKENTTVDTKVPVISTENSNLSDTYCVEDEEVTLMVSVEGDEDDFTYQWYSNTENSNEGGTPIDGATGSSFNPPTDEVGTTYYYVVITNKKNGKTTKSNPVMVRVYPAGTPVEIIQEIANNMLQITAGTFVMGSPAGEAGRYDNETQHSVTLTKSFEMSKYQVTQEQYQAVMGSNPSRFTSAVSGESGTPGKLPVERVSWYQAIVFCNKLSMMEGLSPVYSISGSTDTTAWGTVPTSSNATWNAVIMVSGANGYRLPTEAEWEYACRAGTTTAFNNGNDNYASLSSVGAVGWYYINAESTHQVGLKTPNAWGLYDMHGNVLEWCWDWYETYATGTLTDPEGAVAGSVRVLRGGRWNGGDLRSAYRDSDSPSSVGVNGTLGFRLVRG